MAGHEWDWFQREELIGQISDIRVQNLQVERENVQKRTFTRWMNLHLEKCKPPLEVTDLFVDIQDGKILMALLEVLTGQSLLQEYKSSTHRIFRLNNIAKALKFLEDSNVKLVSIDAAEIADGNPSLVLGLIWNIILFLQIKELTGNLNRMSSSSSLSSLPSGTESDTSHPSTPSTEKGLSVSIKDQRKAIKALLNWVQQRTRKYGVAVQDFAGSWRSGLAFLAVIKAIDSSLVDMRRALEKPPRENLEDAFSIAQKRLSIPRLLEPEDVMVDSPDEHSIMTYVTQFLEHFPELKPDDFSDHTEETPLEMTYVHYKDGPKEEEGKIVTVTKHEDKDFSVEVKTRHLTLPETHEYTEVDIPYDKKPYPEENTRNPFQVSMGIRQSPVQRTPVGFKLDNVSRKLDMSTTASDTLERAGAKKNHNDRNGQGDFLHIKPIAESEPSSNSDAPKEHEPQYGNIVYHINNSSDLIMDKQPIDLFNEKEYFTDNGTIKPSLMSNHHESLPPFKTKEDDDDDACKYVLHSPRDGDHRQMTVFKAYKASMEDQPDHKSHHLTSSIDHRLEETDATDSAFPSKVSVIPHDLFYYPHYSVPIADVLQAFADSCPDGGNKATAASDSSSQSHTDNKGSLNGGTYMNAMTTEGNGITVAKSENTVYLKDILPAMGHKEMLSPEYPEGPISNGSIHQSTHDQHSRNSTFDPGYNTNLQEVESSKKNHRNKGTSRDEFIGGKAGLDDVDFGVIEDKATKLAAETQQKKLKDLSFSRDIQSDSQVYNRKKLNFSDHMNGNHNEDGEKLSEHSRTQGLGSTPPSGTVASSSRLSFWSSQLSDVFYITVLLWLLCYCILILPELDLNKVQFFAFNNNN